MTRQARHVFLLLALSSGVAVAPVSTHTPTPAPMSFSTTKITTVLVVDAVEPSLEFWEKRLGFARVAEVPHEGTIGFALLQRDGVELMLQSIASVRADLPSAGSTIPGTASALFMEVSDLAAVEKALAGHPVAMARRKTFYGTLEIGVKEPGGHWVTFAQPEKGGG